MKTIKAVFLFSFFSLLILAGPVQAQDQIAVPLSNPGQPGQLKLNLVLGSLVVTGHDGNEVIIRADGQELADDRQDQDHDIRNGLRRITGSSSGFEVNEHNNNVTISGVNPFQNVKFEILVPYEFSLDLTVVHGGDLTVENINGNMVIKHVNGNVILTEVGGSALINTVNGNIKAMFHSVEADKPMAFSSVNGDIDVSLPANTGFTAKMRTEWGDVFTDFDMNIRKGDNVNVLPRSTGYRVEVNNWIEGEINEGGPEYLIKTLRGDIYLRKR